MEKKMRDKRKESIEWYEKQISGCTLEVVELGEKVKTFLLRKEPDSMMMSTYIIFTPAGIVISGDIQVCRHGVISYGGYGIGWFASRLDPSYLAEKFLEQRWVPSAAMEAWEECLQVGSEYLGGTAYDPNEVGTLHAIQKEFARLYNLM
jgi:hypothetical protein